MKNFAAQRNGRFRKKLSPGRVPRLADPLGKLRSLRSSRAIESDLMRRIERLRFDQSRSSRAIDLRAASGRKLATSRRASKKEPAKPVSIARSIKLLSQKHLARSRVFPESAVFRKGPTTQHLASMETGSAQKIFSGRNIASIELLGSGSRQSLHEREKTTEKKKVPRAIEEIEEVESVEDLAETAQLRPAKSESRLERAKQRARARLEEMLGADARVEDLRGEIAQKFRLWKKHDLAEIYNFRTQVRFYEIERRLGKGSFGKVYLARQLLTGTRVALKVVSKKSLRKKRAEERIQKEIKVLRLIPPHANVVRLLEVFQDEDYHYLAFEFAELGDLVSYFFRADLFPEGKLRVFFRGFLEGLEHVHRTGVIHRDIKPDNILMDAAFTPKIADFGISNLHSPETPIQDTGGTPLYLSPEVIKNEGGISFATDIWSAGVVLFLMVFGDTPFKGRNMNELFLQILSKEVSFDAREDQAQLQDLLRRMLTKDPRARISLAQIKEHPWLQASGGEQSPYLSGSEDNTPVNLYAGHSRNQSRGGWQAPVSQRIVNSCRNILSHSRPRGSSSRKTPKCADENPGVKKFVTNTSTHNTNKGVPVDGDAEALHKQLQTEAARQVAMEHLVALGFPEEYVRQSVHTPNRIFNHARGCFENLLLALQ